MRFLKKTFKNKFLIKIIFCFCLLNLALLFGLNFLKNNLINHAYNDTESISIKVKNEIENFILSNKEFVQNELKNNSNYKLKRGFFIDNNQNIPSEEIISKELKKELINLTDSAKTTFSILAKDFFDPTLKIHIILIAVPIFKNNKYIGTKVFINSMEKLFDNIKNINANTNSIIIKNTNNGIIPILPKDNNIQSLGMKKNSPISQAILGNFKLNFNNKSGIASNSKHIISLNWTVITQKNIHFKLLIIKTLYFTFFTLFILTLVCLLLLILVFNTNFLTILTFILFLLSVFSASYLARKYTQLSLLNKSNLINEKYLKINNIASLIQSNLNNIKNTLNEIEILLKNNVSEEETRKVLAQNKTIDFIDFVEIMFFDKKEESIRYSDSTSVLYPDTNSKIIDPSQYINEEWYVNATKKPGWSTPINQNGESFIRYTKPIFDTTQKKAIGLISAAYLLSDLKTIVTNSKLHNEEKESIIFNSNGDIILFSELNDKPNKKIKIENLVNYEKFNNLDKILTLARSQGLGVLAGPKYKTFYYQITASDWFYVSTYKNSYFNSTTINIFKTSMLILFNIAIIGLLFLLYIMSSIKFNIRHYILSCIVMTIVITILSASMIFKLYKYQIQNFNDYNINMDKDLILNLTNAKQLGIKPNLLKTGIYVKNIDPNDNNVFQANLWQIKPHNNGATGIEIDNAYMDSFKIKEVFNDKNKIEWKATGNLLPTYSQSFSYPFDKKIIKFILKPLNKNINDLLIVDSDNYKTLNPLSKPALNPQIQIDKFLIKKSYFKYFNDDSNFNDRAKHRKYLTLNIELGRNLTNFFLLFFLPLLIIIIATILLSAININSSNNIIKIQFFSGYTPLLFSLILVHQNLRKSVQAIGLSYAELIFIIGYLLLGFCYIELFISTKSKAYNKIKPFILGLGVSILFFLITFISFYTN